MVAHINITKFCIQKYIIPMALYYPGLNFPTLLNKSYAAFGPNQTERVFQVWKHKAHCTSFLEKRCALRFFMLFYVATTESAVLSVKDYSTSAQESRISVSLLSRENSFKKLSVWLGPYCSHSNTVIPKIHRYIVFLISQPSSPNSPSKVWVWLF